jgi:glutamate racemase
VNRPIGIFDSGLGGLTVVKQIKNILPNENIIYFGDTARVPYGTKSKKTIIEFSKQNTEFLLSHNVKIIVIACNSSTAAAIDEIKNNVDIPVIGVIEPGAKTAVTQTKNKKIGVIGTNATINSETYTHHINMIDPEIKIYSQPCPLFVPLVEEGWINKKVTELVISEYLEPIKVSGVDTLILGCTHYPLLKHKISYFFDHKINIIDSAESCSEEVKTILKNKAMLNKSSRIGNTTFFVSDTPSKFSEIGSKFLNAEFNAVKVV